MARRPLNRSAGLTRRQRRLLVRMALAAAVAALIIARYTSPRSLFKPVPSPEAPAAPPR